jgi:hypothetical protein
MEYRISDLYRGHSPHAAYCLSLNFGEALPGWHLVVSFFHRSSGIVHTLLFRPGFPEGKGDSALLQITDRNLLGGLLNGA